MLVKLQPDKVERGWDYLAPAIERAFTPLGGAGRQLMTNILKSVLLEKAHVWVEINEERTPQAIVVTTYREDIITNNKALLIYGLAVLDGANDADWGSGMETLTTFARARQCSHIEFHVHGREFKRYLSMLGAEEAGSVMIYEV